PSPVAGGTVPGPGLLRGDRVAAPRARVPVSPRQRGVAAARLPVVPVIEGDVGACPAFTYRRRIVSVGDLRSQRAFPATSLAARVAASLACRHWAMQGRTCPQAARPRGG